MTEKSLQAEAYPLVLRHLQEVKGDDFIAVVHLQAPMLLAKESEGWYLFGVRPGVFSAFGATKEEAMTAGSASVAHFFDDLAADAVRAKFEEEIELLRNNIDVHDEERWRLALHKIRSAEFNPPDDLAALRQHKVVGQYPFALAVSYLTAEVERPDLSADILALAA